MTTAYSQRPFRDFFGKQLILKSIEKKTFTCPLWPLGAYLLVEVQGSVIENYLFYILFLKNIINHLVFCSAPSNPVSVSIYCIHIHGIHYVICILATIYVTNRNKGILKIASSLEKYYNLFISFVSLKTLGNFIRS